MHHLPIMKIQHRIIKIEYLSVFTIRLCWGLRLTVTQKFLDRNIAGSTMIAQFIDNHSFTSFSS